MRRPTWRRLLLAILAMVLYYAHLAQAVLGQTLTLTLLCLTHLAQAVLGAVVEHRRERVGDERAHLWVGCGLGYCRVRCAGSRVSVQGSGPGPGSGPSSESEFRVRVRIQGKRPGFRGMVMAMAPKSARCSRP